PGLVPACWEAEDADEESLDALSDGTGEGAVTAHGGLQLAAEPPFELFEVGEGEGLELEDGGVVVAAAPIRPELHGVGALDGGAGCLEGGEVSWLALGAAGVHDEALLEGLEVEDRRQRPSPLESVEEAVSPEFDAEVHAHGEP